MAKKHSCIYIWSDDALKNTLSSFYVMFFLSLILLLLFFWFSFFLHFLFFFICMIYALQAMSNCYVILTNFYFPLWNIKITHKSYFNYHSFDDYFSLYGTGITQRKIIKNCLDNRSNSLPGLKLENSL